MREFWNSLAQQMKPRFHEISTYLIALAFCWLMLFHSELRYGYWMLFTGFETMSPYFVALGFIVTAGLVLSLIHAFSKRKKLAIEKALMGWSILGISGVASFLVGTEMLPSRSSIVTILVTWNILTSIVLLGQMGSQNYEISDDEASLLEVIVTTVILIAILLVSDLHFHFSWALTLSICVFYATFIVFITTWAINFFDLRIPDLVKQDRNDR